MFYLIIAILLVLYYFFMASDSVKNTLDVIGKVGLISLAIVLGATGFMALLHAPTEFYIVVAMFIVALLALRDVLKLKALPETQFQIQCREYIKSKFR